MLILNLKVRKKYMNPEKNNNHLRIKKLPALILFFVLLAGLAGWLIGRSNGGDSTNNQPASGQMNTAPEVSSKVKANSLINYDLPGGWKENSCPEKADIYIAPAGTSVNCDMEPRAPVIISMNSEGATDCNQLQNVQNVSKHVCISEYINGKKALKAETVYGPDSSYKKDTAINAYYIDTGKGVVKLEYVHNPDDSNALSGFEKLAKSVEAKS
jgi:hypothetical protein